jgi:hypothetical protein
LKFAAIAIGVPAFMFTIITVFAAAMGGVCFDPTVPPGL